MCLLLYSEAALGVNTHRSLISRLKTRANFKSVPRVAAVCNNALLVLLHHTSHHTAVCGFWFYCSVSAAAVLPLVLEALLQQSRRYGMTLLGSGSTVNIAAYAVQPEEPASAAVELSRTPVTGRWGLSASVAVCEALGVAWSSHAESHPDHTMVVRVEVVTITGGSTRERAVEQTVDTPWVLESQVRRRVMLQRHRERALTLYRCMQARDGLAHIDFVFLRPVGQRSGATAEAMLRAKRREAVRNRGHHAQLQRLLQLWLTRAWGGGVVLLLAGLEHVAAAAAIRSVSARHQELPEAAQAPRDAVSDQAAARQWRAYSAVCRRVRLWRDWVPRCSRTPSFS